MRRIATIFGLFAVWLMISISWGSSTCQEPTYIEVVAPEIPARPGATFRAATLNLAEETSAERVLEALESSPSLKDLDVLMLQEVVHYPEKSENLVEILADRLQLHAFFGTATEPRLDGALEGLAILSRRPLRDPEVFDLKRFGLTVRSRCRVALAATVDPPGGPIRLLGVHLDTRLNARNRIAQLQPVLDAADRFEGPIILAGDFNTNNNYWIKHLIPAPFAQNQAGKIKAHLEGLGYQTPQKGGPATFRYLGMRLDWVYLRSLTARHWGVEPIDFSDHSAVWVTLGTDTATGRKVKP